MIRENLYQELIVNNQLQAELSRLEKLDAEETIDAITAIVEQCPRDELHHISEKTRGFTSPSLFIKDLHNAVNLRAHIENFVTKPEGFLSVINDIHLGNKFSALLKQSVNRIDTRMAVSEIVKHQSESIPFNLRKISVLLNGTDFLKQLQMAMSVKRQLNLLIETPEKFFTSRDYNEIAMGRYPELVEYYIQNKAASIGEKLQGNSNHLVQERLKSLSRQFPDSSFATIKKAMSKAPPLLSQYPNRVVAKDADKTKTSPTQEESRFIPG